MVAENTQNGDSTVTLTHTNATLSRVISWHVIAGNHNNPSPVKNPAGGVILRFMPQKPKSIAVFKRKSCVLSVSSGFIVEKKY